MIAPAPKYAPYLELIMTDEELSEMWLQEIGAELKRLRKFRGYTQKEMADLLGFGFSTIAKIDQGKIPTFPSFVKYAAALDVDFADLMYKVAIVVKAKTQKGLSEDYPE